MKKAISVAVILVLINMVFVSCQVSGSYTGKGNDNFDYSIYNNNDVIDKGPVKGGTLRLFSTSPDTLNPVLTHNVHVKRFSTLIYEGMFKIGNDQKPIPILVDDWEVSKDKLIYTFYIRQGVTWHDGTPLTAEDIEYTISMIMNKDKDSIYKRNVENIATYAAVDRYTLRVVLRKANSFTPELMTFPILPKHLSLNDGLLLQKGILVPIGTGPYKFDSFKKEKYLKLRAYEDWWNSKEYKGGSLATPYINEVFVNIFNEAEDEIGAFQAGDIHVACIEYPEEYTKYKARSDILLKKYVGRSFDFIAFNMSRPGLSDRHVRQAIAYAIDKEQIIDEVMGERVVPADFPLVPGTWLYDGNDTLAYSHNKDKARKILKDVGWKERDGVLYKRVNGRNIYLKFDLLVNEDNFYRCLMAEKISAQLKKIGIDVIVRKIDWKEERQKISEKSFDMVLIGYRVPSIPDISYMYASTIISPYIEPQFTDGLNLVGYKNERVDEYLKNIFMEVSYDKRKAMLFNMLEIVKEDVPYIGLYFYNNAVLYNRGVRGNLSPYVWDVYNSITEWYIRER